MVPLFVFTNTYNRGLLVLIVIYAIAGLSLDYIMGEMGQFSFGHAAFWGFGAYVSAKLALDLGISPWIGFLAAPTAAGLVGLLIGYIALRRTRGLELAIVTLGGPRRFLLRPRGGGRSRSFAPASGDLLVMGGDCQHQWEHTVPKAAVAQPRMSVTFRRHRPGAARPSSQSM